MTGLLRSKPVVHFAAAVFAALGLCYVDGPATAQGDVVPKDLVVVIQEISDIESMRAINPLNLTAEQVGQIAEEIRKASDSHLKKVTAAASPFQGMAAEVRALRKKLLTGGEVPEDFDKKGRRIQDEFVAKRNTEKNNTLKSLSDSIRAVLKPAQVTKAISVSKTLTRKDGKPTLQGTDDQFFNFWIQSVFIDYPGILPLLDEIKKAREAGAGETVQSSKTAGRTRVVRK